MFVYVQNSQYCELCTIHCHIKIASFKGDMLYKSLLNNCFFLAIRLFKHFKLNNLHCNITLISSNIHKRITLKNKNPTILL